MLARTGWADIQPSPGSLTRLLGALPEVVEVRSTAPFQAVGDALTAQVATATSASSLGSPASFGVGFDASMGGLGPITLTNPETVGGGVTTAGLSGVSQDLSQYDGAERWHADGPLVVRDRETGQLLAVRLDASVTVRVKALALLVSYGLRDDLDVSLALPVTHLAVDSTVGFRLLRQAQGDRFVRVRGTSRIERDVPTVRVAGLGDVSARLKWKLPAVGAWRSALDVQGTFPSGDADKGLGLGTVLVNVTGTGARRFWMQRAEVTSTATLSFDLSDLRETRLLYGVSGSVRVANRPAVVLVAEFLGQSQLTAGADLDDTGVLILQRGSVTTAPAFGLSLGRKDYFDAAFGVRVVLGGGWVAFAAGQVPLNDAGLRPSGITPIAGVGVAW